MGSMLTYITAVYALFITGALFIASVISQDAHMTDDPRIKTGTQVLFALLLMSVAWLAVK